MRSISAVDNASDRMQVTETSTEPTTYDFLQDASADIILRSAHPNQEDFPVHRCVLSIASTVWRDMFAMPQPPNAPAEVPVIDLSESASTLRHLLTFIYPVPDPALDSLDALVPVLEAAMKYDVLVVVHALRAQLVSPRFVDGAPLRVFAIAERFRLEDEIKVASRHTLSVNLLESPLSEDLKHITAYSYQQLLILHRNRATAAQLLFDRHQPGGDYCEKCGHEKRWWLDYKRRAKEELALRPTSDVVFTIKWAAKSATACPGCGANILRSLPYMEMMKQRVDSLPSTI